MINNNFLKYINEYLINEGIVDTAKDVAKNIIPTSQNIKKAQKGDSFLGRAAQQIDNISNTIVNLGDAAKKGDLKGMINAVNTGVNRHAEMKAQWEYRKYILSQNFLKDIKQGSIFVVNKKDEIVTSLINLYPTIKSDIPDELELEVTHVEQMQYNDYHNDNFNQLWGKFYTLPKDQNVYTIFNQLNIGGLFISFNAETITNNCYCTWVDNNLNPIASLEQFSKTVKQESDGKFTLSVFNGNDVGVIISEFLNICNNQNTLSKNFFLLLNNFANTLASQKRKIQGNVANNEIFKMWVTFFNDSINRDIFPNLKLNIQQIKEYFQSANTTPINIKDENHTINIRPMMDKIIQNGSNLNK